MIDPLGILLLQVLIAAASVVVSFLVANYRGEMAATKYAQNETQRREHELILIKRPINELFRNIYYIDNILRNSSQNIDIHQSRSPDYEFFCEHLKTGYAQLTQNINRYVDSYNRIANQVNSIYQSASDLLEKKWGDDPNLNIETHKLKIHINQILEQSSGEFVSRLIHDNEPQLPRSSPQDPNLIIVGSSHINISSLIDSEKIVNDLNLILEGSDFFGELQQIWDKVKPLIKEYTKIRYQLNLLRSLVYAGVHLNGSCMACERGKQSRTESP